MSLSDGFLVGTLIAALLVLLAAMYMLARNDWILKIRLRMIEEDWEGYRCAPDYGTMLYRWWCWDIEKLKNLS